MTRKVRVADAEYGQFRRRVDELVRRVDEGTLGLTSPLVDGLQDLIEGRFSRVDGYFKRDMRREGWTLLDNVPRSVASGNIAGLPIFRDGETDLEEGVFLERCRGMTRFGQEDAEWLLDHQGQIPQELRQFILIFPRTVWGSPSGPGLSCLDWYGSQWGLYICSLGSARDHYRARIAAPSPRQVS